MFTIDLLKGQGIPIKSRPEGIAIAAVTLIVPIIIVIVMFGFYLSNSIAISIQKQRIINYETKIGELSDAVELQKSFEKDKDIINSSLSEVKSSIDRHIQWSPILAMLVKNMPDSVVLTGLETRQKTVRMEMPQKDDPKKKISTFVPVRTLHITVCGSPRSNCGKAVMGFKDSLRTSALLRSKLEKIKVSQGFAKLDDRDVISYDIDCIFKPGL